MKVLNYIKLRVAIICAVYPYYDQLTKWEFFQCHIHSFGNRNNMYRTGRAINRFVNSDTYKIRLFNPLNVQEFKGYIEVKVIVANQIGRNSFKVSFVARKLQNEETSSL